MEGAFCCPCQVPPPRTHMGLMDPESVSLSHLSKHIWDFSKLQLSTPSHATSHAWKQSGTRFEAGGTSQRRVTSMDHKDFASIFSSMRLSTRQNQNTTQRRLTRVAVAATLIIE